MIAGIDKQADINLFLEAEELAALPNHTLEGVLIKVQDPKRQGKITVSINDARSYENGTGIGICDKNYWRVQEDFLVEVFMGTEWYQKLLKKGVVGLRQQMLDGSKIHIYDKSKIEDFMVRMMAENLEFYRDNKARLLER